VGARVVNIVFFYESVDLGGQQTQTYQLVRRLAARGHDVSWAYLYGDGMRPLIEVHAKVRRVGERIGSKDYLRRPWRIVSTARALAAWLRAVRAEVVVSGSGIGSLIAGLAARRTGARHFRLVGCSLRQVEPTLYRVYRWCGIDRLIDGYFGWPAVFAELAGRGVPPRKFIELNNAVDTELFRPLPTSEREQIRRTLGIAPDEVVVGWIGRISPDMQVGNTVQLCARLRRRGLERFRLLLVGGGPWMDGLRAMIDDLGLSDRSVVTGWVPMEQVCRHINAMDIVPLLESDPQGGSIVREAMACGRVALSVDGASGTQRRFMQGDHAVLVSPQQFLERAADAVVALAGDAAGRDRIGGNARRYAVSAMSFDTQVLTMLRAFGQPAGEA
jgi:glycosyltransferase involved in cell wall biosynthesis